MLAYLLLLLSFSSLVVSADDIYTSVFRPDEEVGVSLKLFINYKNGTREIIKHLGNISYAPGKTFINSMVACIDINESLLNVQAAIVFRTIGNTMGFTYNGITTLTTVKPDPTSKRLLLKRSPTPRKANEPIKDSLQWIPAINVFLSFDKNQYKELPRNYYKNDTQYLPYGTTTPLLEPQSNYIDLNETGNVTLPLKVNVTVVPIEDAWKIAIKANFFLKSANFLSNSDFSDAQNLFHKVDPYYIKFLGIISFAHIVLTFLSIKNDVKRKSCI